MIYVMIDVDWFRRMRIWLDIQETCEPNQEPILARINCDGYVRRTRLTLLLVLLWHRMVLNTGYWILLSRVTWTIVGQACIEFMLSLSGRLLVALNRYSGDRTSSSCCNDVGGGQSYSYAQTHMHKILCGYLSSYFMRGETWSHRGGGDFCPSPWKMIIPKTDIHWASIGNTGTKR